MFLASVEGPIISSNASFIAVNVSVACSLLPMICSHDIAQPDCTDSFMASNIPVTVRTSVADLSAAFAISTIAFACVAEYPWVLNSDSLYAPEICFNVSIITSAVNHSPLVKLSLKLPYFFIIFSAPVPITSDVLINAFWNASPLIPALINDLQSINCTLPAANACDI